MAAASGYCSLDFKRAQERSRLEARKELRRKQRIENKRVRDSLGKVYEYNCMLKVKHNLLERTKKNEQIEQDFKVKRIREKKFRRDEKVVVLLQAIHGGVMGDTEKEEEEVVRVCDMNGTYDLVRQMGISISSFGGVQIQEVCLMEKSNSFNQMIDPTTSKLDRVDDEKIKFDVVSKRKLGRSRKKNRSRGLLRKIVRGSNPVKEKHFRRENTGEVVHECKICMKVFNTDTKLTHHTSIHIPNCQKRCCEQIFSTKFDLNHHVKFFHKNLREYYNCQYENCPQSFTAKSEVDAHMVLAHFGVIWEAKPSFKCIKCSIVVAKFKLARKHFFQCLTSDKDIHQFKQKMQLDDARLKVLLKYLTQSILRIFLAKYGILDFFINWHSLFLKNKEDYGFQDFIPSHSNCLCKQE
jgi:hypothetical protein